MTIDPGDSAPVARASVRRRRSHAALGSRVFVGGLAISGTLGLAGMMARRPLPAAAAPVREAALAIVAEPARVRATPAKVRRVPAPAAAHGRVAVSIGSGTRSVAPASVVARVTSSNPAPAPVPAQSTPAPTPVPVQTAAPQSVPAPAPTPPPIAPAVAPPTAAPVATTHASPAP